MRSPLGQILSQGSNTENLEDIVSDIMQKENKLCFVNLFIS